MARSRILITTSSFAPRNEQPLAEFVAKGFEIVRNPYGRRLSEAEIGELMDGDVVGMIAGLEPLTKGVIDRAPNLKVISRCGIGLDNVDLDHCAGRKVSVVNTPEAPAIAVAELAMGMILSLIRGVTMMDRDVRVGRWKRFEGRLLRDLTVGIVGLGRVGRAVAVRLEPFGCRLIGSDVMGASVPGVELMDLHDVLTKADVVTLHVPLDATTRGLIGPQNLSVMKPGAYLINTSRGGLVDEEALFEALQSGHLAGAALDVFEEEPYEGALTKLPTAVLTSHAGSSALETRTRMEQEAAQNLADALNALAKA